MKRCSVCRSSVDENAIQVLITCDGQMREGVVCDEVCLEIGRKVKEIVVVEKAPAA